MKASPAEKYAKALADLEGKAFELEVCACLASAVLGFQQIPEAPQGDGGLDGLSHDGQRGYCCYGPQYSAAKTARERVTDIVTKFLSDLRKLFELEPKGKSGKSFDFRENKELGTILAEGQRLLEIKLITNWFGSHQIIGRISTAVLLYKKASKCRFVDPNVQVSILGPKELTNTYPIDELALTRVAQWGFAAKVEAAAQTITIKDPRSYEAKISELRKIRPDQIGAIDTLAETLRLNWRRALAFDRQLIDSVPGMHQSLERGRQHIAERVTYLMLSSAEPWKELGRATEIAREILQKDFETSYGSLVPMIASGEVARLIGECSIGWKKVAQKE